MAITFESVIQQVLNELGNVKGANPVAADSNFTATPSTATVLGPDFIPSMVQPALAATLSELVEVIASMPHHPERMFFGDVTAALANLDPVPQVGNTGARIIGVPGYIKDSSDNKACRPATLDAVRSYNRFPAIYTAADSYWYCINGGRIEHTRTAVIMEVCVYTRPSGFTGNIGIEEWHEGGLVWGIVAKLALKESLFQPLYDGANQCWKDHLTETRALADPSLYGAATAAPASA